MPRYHCKTLVKNQVLDFSDSLKSNGKWNPIHDSLTLTLWFSKPWFNWVTLALIQPDHWFLGSLVHRSPVQIWTKWNLTSDSLSWCGSLLHHLSWQLTLQISCSWFTGASLSWMKPDSQGCVSSWIKQWRIGIDRLTISFVIWFTFQQSWSRANPN